MIEEYDTYLKKCLKKNFFFVVYLFQYIGLRKISTCIFYQLDRMAFMHHCNLNTNYFNDMYTVFQQYIF